jgi:CubicO group peptidase (beta-lactamase class C family)
MNVPGDVATINQACQQLIAKFQAADGNDDNNYVVAVAYVPPASTSLDAIQMYWNQPTGKEPYPQNSAFAIGSVTKTFTASLLGYGDAVSTAFAFNTDSAVFRMNAFLPPYLGAEAELSPWVQNMSLRMLAQHMSGFFDNLPDPDGQTWGQALFNGTALSATPESLLEFWQEYPGIYGSQQAAAAGTYPDSYPPGSCWQYSDMGFVTLGYALVTGFSWLAESLGIDSSEYPTLLGSLITEPLNMAETFCGEPPKVNPTDNMVAYFNGTSVKGGTYAAPDIKQTATNLGAWVFYNLYPAYNSVPPLLTTALQHATTPFDPRIQCTAGDVPACLPCLSSDGGWGPNSMGLAWQASELTPGQSSPQLMSKNGGSSTGGCSTWVGLIPDGEAGPMGLAIVANGWWNDDNKDIHVSVDGTGLTLLQYLYEHPNG